MSGCLKKIGRMPRPQDREAVNFATGNANSPKGSEGLSQTCSGHPRNEGGRQGGTADVEQANVGAKFAGRVISAISMDLRLRLAAPRLSEIEGKSA